MTDQPRYAGDLARPKGPKRTPRTAAEIVRFVFSTLATVSRYAA